MRFSPFLRKEPKKIAHDTISLTLHGIMKNMRKGVPMTLHAFFELHPKAALGFSGGVDSAYLLHAAREAGADVKPYFIKTPFQPAFELEDAKKLAPELTVLELDTLNDETIAANPADRCYHCKKALFSHLKARAEADGYFVLLDGTNASDSWDDRPGMRALEELGVLSPLRLCGLTKDEIRRLSKEAGLFTWDKPAYACLATRVPTGTPIDRETLQNVEAAEAALMELGYRDLRVRIFHGAAQVQLKREQFPKTDTAYTAILQAVQPHFCHVFLDLQGR